MARPRIVKYPDGEVVLRNFPKERSDELIKLLNPTKENIVSSEEESTQAPTEESECSEEALAISPFENKWKVVTVKYNVETGKAFVASTETFDSKIVANNTFKVACFKKGFV